MRVFIKHIKQNVTKGNMILTSFLFFALINVGYAELHLVLRQGIRAAVPIAVLIQQPASTEKNSDPAIATTKQQVATNVGKVIRSDLQNSGHFRLSPVRASDANKGMSGSSMSASDVDYRYWKSTGNNYLVVGNAKLIGPNKYQVTFSLLNILIGANNKSSTMASPILVSRRYIVKASQFRRLAHRVSDIIYQQITGIPGIFSTKIAYVLVKREENKRPHYLLEVADQDGFNPRPLAQSSEPLMSPAWSPNGSKIAFVSLANRQATILIANVARGKVRVVSRYPGINGAPAWSPNGKSLALVLSKNSRPKIYRDDLATNRVKQLTFGMSIDTEPSWSPDGKSIIFTSNRGGGPQIYQLLLSSGKVKRMTFDGNYNARSSFTPDGKNIVVLHRDDQGYNIAIQNIASGALTVLTKGGYDSSPSVAPNGEMMVYANDETEKGTLGIVSRDGKVKLKLPAPEGTVQEPAWGPFGS